MLGTNYPLIGNGLWRIEWWRQPCKIFLGHKKWWGYFIYYSPLLKVGLTTQPPNPPPAVLPLEMRSGNVVRTADMSLSDVHLCIKSATLTRMVFGIGIASIQLPSRLSICTTCACKYRKLEAIQTWSAICRVWSWTLTYQKFLLCISS